MSTPTPLVLLHGVGQAPMAWEDVVVRLYGTRRLLTPWVPGLLPTAREVPSLVDSAGMLDQTLMLEGMTAVDLCGLSYGAMVAAQTAATYPERVRRLVLIAGQIRPPRLLMRAQAAALRLVPAARLADAGVSKDRLRSVLAAASGADLSDALPRITAPTLVLVGERDRANQPAARAIAGLVPAARLEVVPGAGHTVNTDAPAALADLLTDFLA